MRVVAHRPLEVELADVEAAEQRVEPRLRNRRRAERRQKGEVAGTRQLRVHRRLARKVPDAPAHLHAVTLRIETEDQGRSARRPQQVEQHADGGRLPGAIRAEKAEHFALLYFEGQVLDADNGTVVLRQRFETNRRNAHDQNALARASSRASVVSSSSNGCSAATPSRTTSPGPGSSSNGSGVICTFPLSTRC